MDTPKIIRLEPNGPPNVGLSRLGLRPEDFQSELPEQFWHVYFKDDRIGLTVGVWTTTSMQESFGPYPGNEFMVILEGTVALLDADGQETVARQGDTFAVANGAALSWKQEGFCRKFFLIYDPPNTATPADRATVDSIAILQRDLLEACLDAPGAGNQTDTGPDAQSFRTAVAFTSDAGDMSVGLACSNVINAPDEFASDHEFVQVLKGHFSVTEAGGAVHQFSPGDVFFVPSGTKYSWTSSASISVYFCAVAPAVQSQAG